MKVIDHGTVFLGEAGSEYSSACFHGICVLPDGAWLACFRASPAKHNTFPQRFMITRSNDQGQTWTDPVEPLSPPPVNGVPGVWRGGDFTALGGRRVVTVLYWVDASDPSLPFFNEKTEGLLDSHIFLASSDDNGLTWSEPRLVDTAPFRMPTPITGPVLILPNGEWVLQFETNKTYYDTSVWHHSSVLMFSRDECKTWREYVAVADPEARYFYWDQRPAVLLDGTMLDMFWTFDREKAVYLNIHACKSRNNVRTLSDLWDTGIPGQPGSPVSFADGRIAMPYVDRERTPIIKVRTSVDGGRSWPDASEIIIDDSRTLAQQRKKNSMQDAWSEMGAFSIGLPRSVRLPDGHMLVVYYAGPEQNHTGIYWVRIMP